jgi:hypothetical protein
VFCCDCTDFPQPSAFVSLTRAGLVLGPVLSHCPAGLHPRLVDPLLPPVCAFVGDRIGAVWAAVAAASRVASCAVAVFVSKFSVAHAFQQWCRACRDGARKGVPCEHAVLCTLLTGRLLSLCESWPASLPTSLRRCC